MKFDWKFVHNIDELAMKLLKVLLPDDDRTDTEEHEQISYDSEAVIAIREFRIITADELYQVLFLVGRKKEPIYD